MDQLLWNGLETDPQIGMYLLAMCQAGLTLGSGEPTALWDVVLKPKLSPTRSRSIPVKRQVELEQFGTYYGVKMTGWDGQEKETPEMFYARYKDKIITNSEQHFHLHPISWSYDALIELNKDLVRYTRFVTELLSTDGDVHDLVVKNRTACTNYNSACPMLDRCACRRNYDDYLTKPAELHSDLTQVSASRYKTWLTCPEKWYAKYVLNKAVSSDSGSLDVGGWFHECIEHYAEDVCLHTDFPSLQQSPEVPCTSV